MTASRGAQGEAAAVREVVLGKGFNDKRPGFWAYELSAPWGDVISPFLWQIWARPGLPLKTRCLVQVAIFTALDRAAQLRTYVPGILRAGNTAEEAVEVAAHCAPYCGFSRAVDSVRAIVECSGSDTDARRADPAAPGNPEAICEAVLGSDAPRLLAKTRCLSQVAILTALDRHAELREHLPGILRAGNTPDEIMEVVLQCAVYCGFPKAADSVQALLETVAGAPAVVRPQR